MSTLPGLRASAAVMATVAGVTLLAGCATSVPGGTARVAPGDELLPPVGAMSVRVERVVDGDTFIAVRRGKRLRVRLIGVDAPESVRPGTPVQCYGRRASRVLARLLPVGTQVEAAYEPGGHQDRFGRELWDVWLPDGRFVQEELVRAGAAVPKAYEPQVVYASYLGGLGVLAKSRGAGLYSACRGR